MQPRTALVRRDTQETRVRVKLVVDGKGRAKVRTGVPFFDHMLTLFAKHSTTDLELTCAISRSMRITRSKTAGSRSGRRFGTRWGTRRASGVMGPGSIREIP
jgi:imidazoleglycerol-phosphate dehydratase